RVRRNDRRPCRRSACEQRDLDGARRRWLAARLDDFLLLRRDARPHPVGFFRETRMSAIDLLEQAAALLRRAPGAAIVEYLFGAVPFLVGFLFFVNEMTRSPFAAERLAPWSLALAILFIWKNVFRARFSAALYATLSPASRRPSSLLRLIAIQAA